MSFARHRRRARLLGVDLEEAAAWRNAAKAMLTAYDERRQVHPQAERFDEH